MEPPAVKPRTLSGQRKSRNASSEYAKALYLAFGMYTVLVADQWTTCADMLRAAGTNRSKDNVERAVSNLPVVTEGSEEIFRTYSLFIHSFEHDRNSPEAFLPRHTEFLIDRQGYIRARWIAGEGTGWLKLENLLGQVEILSQEKSQATVPDDHVH
jgi:hypothetical protein